MHRIHTNIESLCCRPETKVMLHVNYIGFLEGCLYGSSLVAQTVKCLPTMPTMWETQVQSLGQEDLLEKEMATPSSILARKIPWMVEPGRLQSMGLQRVGYD